MNLPRPGDTYSRDVANQTNLELEREDRRNYKRDGDVELKDNRLILTAPNGTRWRVSVDNTGAITTTAL